MREMVAEDEDGETEHPLMPKIGAQDGSTEDDNTRASRWFSGNSLLAEADEDGEDGKGRGRRERVSCAAFSSARQARSSVSALTARAVDAAATCLSTSASRWACVLETSALIAAWRRWVTSAVSVATVPSSSAM